MAKAWEIPFETAARGRLPVAAPFGAGLAVHLEPTGAEGASRLPQASGGLRGQESRRKRAWRAEDGLQTPLKALKTFQNAFEKP